MSASVLIATNASHEPPGLLESWLVEAGLSLRVLPAWRGTPVPGRWADVRADALVVMGGPQSAYDDPATLEPDSPWLPALKHLLREAALDGVPVLAVCLGAQLLAEACGGLVRPGDAGGELGARLVAKRDAAASDPLLASLPMMPDVVQWHWDEIAVLPPEATLLASSTAYPNQAYRIGKRAYGLQFHIETTPEIVAGWAEHDAQHLGHAGEPGSVDPQRLLQGVAQAQQQMEATWQPIVARFASMVTERVGP